jgi:hypothetical protein
MDGALVWWVLLVHYWLKTNHGWAHNFVAKKGLFGPTYIILL